MKKIIIFVVLLTLGVSAKAQNNNNEVKTITNINELELIRDNNEKLINYLNAFIDSYKEQLGIDDQQPDEEQSKNVGQKSNNVVFQAKTSYETIKEQNSLNDLYEIWYKNGLYEKYQNTTNKQEKEMLDSYNKVMEMKRSLTEKFNKEQNDGFFVLNSEDLRNRLLTDNHKKEFDDLYFLLGDYEYIWSETKSLTNDIDNCKNNDYEEVKNSEKYKDVLRIEHTEELIKNYIRAKQNNRKKDIRRIKGELGIEENSEK